MTVDPRTSLAALVLDEPSRAELFESLGFDYCCHGDRTLGEACAQRELDVDTVVEVLAVQRPRDARDADREYDWRRASTGDLVDHIVESHHDRLRRELPRLTETLTTVARVHGSAAPELHDLARVFAALRRELEAHLEHEEQVLFPACRTLEAGAEPREAAQALLGGLEHDHADVAETLLVLRDLAGDYRREAGRCGTHRALIDGLRALERDLHQHIHEENNVLFPRVRSLLAA